MASEHLKARHFHAFFKRQEMQFAYYVLGSGVPYHCDDGALAPMDFLVGEDGEQVVVRMLRL